MSSLSRLNRFHFLSPHNWREREQQRTSYARFHILQTIHQNQHKINCIFHSICFTLWKWKWIREKKSKMLKGYGNLHYRLTYVCCVCIYLYVLPSNVCLKRFIHRIRRLSHDIYDNFSLTISIHWFTMRSGSE